MKKENKPTRYYSKRQEKGVANSLGLKVQPNSGATPFMKGDLTDEYLVVECKTITKKQTSRTIKKEWFTTTLKEQFAMGKSLSAVAFDFGDGENYIAVREQDFKKLYHAWRKENELYT